MDFKTVILLLTISTGLSNAYQDFTPPEPVLKEFEKLYPDVKDVEWEKEGDNFEAEFIFDGSEISVEFNADGRVLKTEIEGDEEEDSDEIIENENIENDDDD